MTGLPQSQKKQRMLQTLHQREGVYQPEPKKRRLPAKGVWSNRLLDENERTVFRDIIDRLYADFDLNNSSDLFQAELVALSLIKLGRAMEAAQVDAYSTLERMVRANLKDLKATKLLRDKQQPTTAGTPAEWAAAILAEAKAAASSSNPRKRGRPARKRKETSL